MISGDNEGETGQSQKSQHSSPDLETQVMTGQSGGEGDFSTW